MSGFTSATMVGANTAPCRSPPVTTRAPPRTASFTQDSTLSASLVLIMALSFVSSAKGLPTLIASTRGLSASRKSP